MHDEDALCGVNGCLTALPISAQPSSENTSPVPQLTVVSDVICPWCYVAKKNLEKALQLLGNGLPVPVTWQPYQLNPDMPKEGMNRREYRSRKFGSWAYSQQLDRQVAAAGEGAGIPFRHDLMDRTPNTFEAHRLIWLAEEEGQQDAVVEALFRAYFTEGRDVGNQQILGEIAKQAGLSEGMVAAFLNGTAGAENVRREAEATQRRGIWGVPTLLVNGETLFSGALPPEQMARRLAGAVVSHA